MYIAVGVMGSVFHFHELPVSPADGIWIELTELPALVCGVFMLRGHNRARWGALAWMTGHVVLSAFHASREFAVHALMCAVIAGMKQDK